MKYQQELEDHIFSRVTDLFDLPQTVKLYDWTNTYLEGQGDANVKAQFGRSKEKRSDCLLVTLALVLDGGGFVRRSKTFDGNFSAVEVMLKSLRAQPGALVVMDAGIAMQAEGSQSNSSVTSCCIWLSVFMESLSRRLRRPQCPIANSVDLCATAHSIGPAARSAGLGGSTLPLPLRGGDRARSGCDCRGRLGD
ncbi:MAG: hypothetical protein IPN53_20470 [Comamonadaceae bacterium]|nr:hypothetical protein [Comamonadaceae bacterium]